MKRLLSFVGMGELKETEYSIGQQKCRTKIVQEALCEFFRPDSIILFATMASRKKNGILVEDACKKFTDEIEIVEIPEGNDTGELWEIFSRINGAIKEGDTLIFDLTHSFRSIPFICFLSVAYLKELKGAKVERIVYGRLERTEAGTSPIVDLTGFTVILDWMNSVHIFLNRVDAEELRNLIAQVQNAAYRSDGKVRPSALKKFGENLKLFTDAVLLSRPDDVLVASRGVVEKLGDVEEEIRRFTPALVPVLERIREVESFSRPENTERLTLELLEMQWRLVEYQWKKRLLIQAIELAREWFVNYVMFRLDYNLDRWRSRETRVEVEKTLNAQKEHLRRGDGDLNPELIRRFGECRDRDEIVKLWDGISNLRNNIAHCGMNNDDIRLHNLINKVNNTLERIKTHWERFRTGGGNPLP